MSKVDFVLSSYPEGDADLLVSYLFGDDKRKSVAVTDNPDFPWERIGELLVSDKLTYYSFDTLCCSTKSWDYSLIDFDVLFTKIQYFISSYDNFGYIVTSVDLMFDPYIVLTESKEVAFSSLMPASFVYKIYDLFSDAQVNEHVYFASWLKILAYPGLSSEFKTKVWEEKKPRILKNIGSFKLSSGNVFVDDYLFDYFVWNNFPSTVMFDLFLASLSNGESQQGLPFRFSPVWKTALVEGLSAYFPSDDLVGMPVEWLDELAVSLFRTQKKVF